MSIQTVSSLGDLAKGVDARFLEVFDENESAYISRLKSIFKVKSSDKAREQTKLKAGLGLLQKKTEGDVVPRTNQQFAYQTEFIPDTYAKGVTVTMEELQDRDWTDKLDEFKDLTLSSRLSEEKAMAQVLNGAFATTVAVNGFDISFLNDAVPMCSTVHPRYDGGSSQSNASSTGITLDDDNLETARLAVINQLTDDGTPVSIMDRFMLVVPPALEKTAQQITGSELVIDTANNNVNIYKGKIDVMSVNWLGAAHGGSDLAWFLIVPGQSKLMFIDRLSPTFDMNVDGNTKDRSYDVLARWSVGYSDWRYTWGSKGDGVAYSS